MPIIGMMIFQFDLFLKFIPYFSKYPRCLNYEGEFYRKASLKNEEFHTLLPAEIREPEISNSQVTPYTEK